MNRVVLTVLFLWLFAPAPAHAQASDTAIGPRDVLSITVANHPEFSGKFTVDQDGAFAYALIGRVEAGGLTLPGLEAKIRALLADGYLKDPRVSVTNERFRAPMIHVVGEVRQPGTYPLVGRMTLLEALARAGSVTDRAGTHVVITRTADTRVASIEPRAVTASTTEVIRVELESLLSGTSGAAIVLRDGDSILVPPPQFVFVAGEVKSPGRFAFQPSLTVLQAMALAGGLTERGSDKRIRLVREVDGRRTETKVTLNTVLKPGDTIVVGQRFF